MDQTYKTHHFPLGVGTHQISLTVGNLDNNCYDTVNKDIIIYPLPNAEFIANDICFGDTLFVQNHFSQDVVKWIYDMGDNKDLLYDLNPSYLYSQSWHIRSISSRLYEPWL
ncbi:MAG: hypothetical protein CM15mP112_08430 [Flavobacteriales bacterium]|nr:MAG: hypothetical protein CM15mP112_08430 [Flavobacteriales bacterium]